jgi:hypothetical protein
VIKQQRITTKVHGKAFFERLGQIDVVLIL